ncbi:MAG: hypothetical protein ACT4OO_04725 [Nitrospiraceae bacterium]
MTQAVKGADKWEKQGLIFTADGRYPWMISHAQVPLVDEAAPDILRIYFGTRDQMNRTVTTYIEVQAENPSRVVYVHNRPVLDLGELGCFDDSGVMPSWILDHNGIKYFYYIGWNVGTTVPYRNSIGVAISTDGGRSFTRLHKGPILDRTNTEPHFCATPCVLVEGELWRMWYLSCVRWEFYGGRAEPYYHIKYAESNDGLSWKKRGLVAIDFKSPEEGGIVRPCVIRENGIYKMWYSYRYGRDFRIIKRHSYRIGYAESYDGLSWKRKDESVGIDVSESGWDSEMIAYPYVYCKDSDCKYLFYNGNGFGKSGLGYAVWSADNSTGVRAHLQ